MREFILLQLLKPTLHRLGTMAGGYLAALNVASDDINLIVAGVTALAGVAVDLILDRRK